MTISIAALLKQQSPSRHFGHGWIELPGGQRWNPGRTLTVKPRAHSVFNKWMNKREGNL
ncbi:phage filamentation protein Fil family protein [Sodalis sp. RH24]|uniref:phage filamentation protein Fil family protein n=1 Tax=unclassified Sodalis (in: enterobacteria) TaxID=2636512 RepID=UPI0039B6703C